MDWKEEKQQILEHARCVVFKVGSAVLTDAEGLNASVMASLSRQIAALRGPVDGQMRRIILVTSAAVAAGRSVLTARGVPAQTAGLSARQAAAAIGQGRLIRAWDDAFAAQGLAIAQVLLTRDDFRSSERLLNAKNTFAELLSWGIIPVVNENDTVSTAELKFGDNDSLSSLLVTLTGAELFVNITSAPGVFGANPAANPETTVMPVVEDVFALNLGQLCGGKTSVGTGGMYSKLLAARRAAQRGAATFILPGRSPDVLIRAFAGEEPLGTWVRPRSRSISTRKFWLAYKSSPSGTVEIDDGAAEALEHRGCSLLPGGVVAVQGSFQKGALVRVTHHGLSMGVGLSNYSSAEIERIRGLRRIEVAAILGDAHYPEVIHRDNFLLDAAI